MTTETRIKALLSASPDSLKQIDRILSGEAIETDTGDRRLLTINHAAKEMGVSRQTVWRMVQDGRLASIETRAGRRRIPSAAITEFLKGATA